MARNSERKLEDELGRLNVEPSEAPQRGAKAPSSLLASARPYYPPSGPFERSELPRGAKYLVAPVAHGLGGAGYRIYEGPDGSQQQRYVSEMVRQRLLRRAVLSQGGSDPDDPLIQGLPGAFHRYYDPYPLEDPGKDATSKVFFVPSFYYKASDGVMQYAVRKLDAVALADHHRTVIDAWRTIRHPNVVTLHEVFSSSAFNNVPALFFAYDYHPDADTLEHRFCLSPRPAIAAAPLDEHTLWAILIQLLSALRSIHDGGLAALRLLHPSKVIVTDTNRVRISSTGVADLFDPSPRSALPSRQSGDISRLGLLMLKLASGFGDATPQDLFLLPTSYCPDFHYVLRSMLGRVRHTDAPTLDDLLRLLSPRLLRHLDDLYDHADDLEAELQKEFDNGRLFRLVAKLGFINERPEYDYSTSWSETGDRYLLKLFRDYVFHQVDRAGRPVLNLSHVVDSLNKLDLGVPERVVLMTRDEKSMFLIKYSELKRHLDESLFELYRSQAPPHLP